MTKVITYGTFDLFHYGHLHLLRRARLLGDHLTVAVSTDRFNQQKNKKSIHSFAERCNNIRAIRFVDEVIAEDSWEQKSYDIQRLSIDVFVMGDDWAGRFDFLSRYCRVIYLPRTAFVSSTALRGLSGIGGH